MMKRFQMYIAFGFALLVFVSTATRADTLDRINQCEEEGGGSCVFDILRELASRPTNERVPALADGIYKIPDSHNFTRVEVDWQGDRIAGVYYHRIGNFRPPATRTYYKCRFNVCSSETSTFEIRSTTKFVFVSGGRDSTVWVYNRRRE